MTKTFLLFIAFLISLHVNGQENEDWRNVAVKWAPTGLILGSLSFHGEYNKGKNSFTAKIGLPVNSHHSFDFDDKDAAFDLKATSFQGGYRIYLSKNIMKGLYLEPFLKYVKLNSTGTGEGTLDNEPVLFNFTNTYEGFGAGVQLGAQFLVGERFVIDLFFLGPELNVSNSHLKAVEASNTIPWTTVQAADAEAQIRSFINQFPFIKNNTEITVDKERKTVLADFKGLLPGIRSGVSFGIRF